jgi:hypothetical protein
VESYENQGGSRFKSARLRRSFAENQGNGAIAKSVVNFLFVKTLFIITWKNFALITRGDIGISMNYRTGGSLWLPVLMLNH